jgi:hypothetical protein
MVRIKPERAHFIPKKARKIAHKGSSAVVYAYEAERAGKVAYLLLGFAGRRQKPDFHYRYPSAAAREAKAKAYFESVAASEAIVKDRKAKPHELAVGDVLRSSWGYDQTNIDFYEVVGLIGKSMVEIREIGGAGYEDGFMSGQVVPLKGDFRGEPMRKRAEGNSVKVRSWGVWAYKMEPKIVGGVPVYESSRNSWYA